MSIDQRVKNGGFAIALSGGGHRATLATLGALMAIVDRGLGPKVIQVASVSGGSITNAFVGQRADLTKLAPQGLDGIGAELATTIIRKGVLTPFWLAVLIGTPLLLGGVVGIAVHPWVVPWSWLAAFIGLAATMGLFLFCGRAIEWLLDRRYFGRSGGGQSACIESLGDRKVDHIFCMTDLVLGLPLYVSSQAGGVVLRTLRNERESDKLQIGHSFGSPGLRIAELVRASAAFPGIPPLRVSIPPDPKNTFVAESPHIAFLADGGMWNNLGSQALREDKVGHEIVDDGGVLRPRGPVPDMPLLCVNASARKKWDQKWQKSLWNKLNLLCFAIPGIVFFKWVFQIMQVLSANTIFPRVAAMRRTFERDIHAQRLPDSLDSVDLVVDLREAADFPIEYMNAFWPEEAIRMADPAVKKWEKSVADLVRETLKGRRTMGLTEMLLEKPYCPEPEGRYPVAGREGAKELLADSRIWKDLVETEGNGSVDSPTTLGRIRIKIARRLIARGYLNTYRTSLLLAPLADGEIEQLAFLSDRLDKIVGQSRR